MQGKLRTCAIMSLIVLTGLIIIIIVALMTAEDVENGESIGSAIYFLGLGAILVISSWITSIVIGIMIMRNLHDMPTEHHTIATFTAILAIFGGLGVTNFIVGMLAAKRAVEISE